MRLPEVKDRILRLENDLEIEMDRGDGGSPDTLHRLEDELDYDDYAADTMKAIAGFESWASYLKRKLSVLGLFTEAWVGKMVSDKQYRDELVGSARQLATMSKKHDIGGDAVLKALDPKTGSVTETVRYLRGSGETAETGSDDYRQRPGVNHNLIKCLIKYLMVRIDQQSLQHPLWVLAFLRRFLTTRTQIIFQV